MNTASATAPLRIIFAGTPDFAAASLQALLDGPHEVIAVYTQPDRPAGRGRKLTPSPVKALALEHDIAVYQPVNFKTEDAVAELAALDSDLMVVAAYGLILPANVLALPQLGCINVHASLLPRWRGAAPIQRAIAAGDRETGITIMQMDVGLDTGDMLHKAACSITTEDTGATLHDKLAALGGTALTTVLADLPHFLANAETQDDGLATYAHKLEKAEARIDWAQPAEVIARQVRAFNSWPVVHARLGEQTLRVWAAEAVNQTSTQAVGTIIAAGADGLDVATGEGILRIQQLQLPGSKALPVAAVLNAKRDLFAPGSTLS